MVTPEDTIAAIATPPGEGGLAVIRLSGARALAIADQCFRPGRPKNPKPSACPSHTLHYGHVVRDGRVLDEVMLAVLRAPRTFTREDVVEVSCHGGVLASKMVLDTLLQAGARLAEPGEFTRRAFLNGRLDLTQAEAVADLIHARTELALSAAQEQLAGHLSQRIHQLRDDLMSVLAHVEAHIDFPDEDIAPDTMEQLLARLRAAEQFMETLLRTAEEGRVLRQGIRTAIVGRPNAGKSSLLNRLLGEDRAIVTAQPGTTRDTIEETANIRGIPVVFVDTAGLRTAENEVEKEGIRRSHQAAQRAELVLQVVDASRPLDREDRHWLETMPARRRIVVLNKTDLPRTEAVRVEGAMEISCRTGQGLEALKDRIRQLACSGAGENLQVTINSRHQDALRRARDSMAVAAGALGAGDPLEMAAFDLRTAVHAVGEIVGKTTTEDLLDAIFGQFCIGK